MGARSHLKTFLLKADRAYRMRIEGLPLERIADMLGETEERTKRLLKRKLGSEIENQESEEETRALELSRLDYLVNQLMGRIQGDGEDNKAIELLLKCQVRRAGLMGTDLGKQGEISVSDLSDSEVRNQVLKLIAPESEGEMECKPNKLNDITDLDEDLHS